MAGRIWGDGNFEFKWMEDDFNAMKNQMIEDRKEKNEKMLSKEPFVSGARVNKGKHEQTFADELASFLNIDEQYEHMTLQAAKIKWIRECNILAGDFKPSTLGRSTADANRMSLPDMVRYISRKLSNDWEDSIFAITTNPEDFIEIKWKAETIESAEGLHAYMNVFVQTDAHIGQYKLRKVVQNWDIVDEEGNIYYQLAPPWVRLRVTDTYYTLFPDKIPRFSTTMSHHENFSTDSRSPRKPTMYSLKESEIDFNKTS